MPTQLLIAPSALSFGHAAANCPGISAFNPVCQVVGGVTSTVATAGASFVFSAMAGWVEQGAAWLLAQIGAVLNATTSVDVGASWFVAHYRVMLSLVVVVALPLFLATAIQAVFRQDPSILVRAVVVHLPLAMVLAGAGIELVRMGLAATDALSGAVASGSGNSISNALSGVSNALVGSTNPGAPTFVLLLGALLVSFGAFVLWVELLVRAAAIYVAALFLPLALATLLWPSISHWCRRLVETLVALVLSKFVIVAILSLAVGALSSGTAGSGDAGAGFASVLAGGALLLLAAFSPFTLLRLIPLAEASAIGHLEGARQRVRHAFGNAPRAGASLAMSQLGAIRGARATPSVPTADFGTPGVDPGEPAGSASGVGGGGGSVPMWPGDPTAEADMLRQLFPASGERRPKGPMPVVWGPVPRRDRGTHEIGLDHLGPVIRWIPPSRPGAKGTEDARDRG